MKKILIVIITCLLVFSSSAAVIYDSLSKPQTSSIAVYEMGNTVTLSGSSRFVTSFTFTIYPSSPAIGQTNDFVLRFYLPTAPGEYPGKLFWQSPPKTNIVMTGGSQTITFEVPYVRVPNTFIYSVMQSGIQDGILYFPLCSGPIIGSSPAYGWTNLRKYVPSGSKHMLVRIEAQERPDADLLGTITHSATYGSGAEDYYTMRFQMRVGGYSGLNGPYFCGITEWDKGSFMQLKATEVPIAVDYLTNGTDDIFEVIGISLGKGNVESNTIVKSPGIAEGYPDLCGYMITDFVLKLDNTVINHSTPGWTYFTWNVTWEIWGFEKTADFNRDGKVDLTDFSILASAWDSQQGQTGWNEFCDINLPNDKKIDLYDLQRFCSNWLD